jgi:DNA-nicking Smr family endonuclease
VSKGKPPRPSHPAPPRVQDDPMLSDEDRRLFEQAFADVRPLRPGPSRVVFEPSEQPPSAGKVKAKKKGDGGHAIVVERQGNFITGAAYGVSHQMVRALGRGEIRSEATCDLHGLGAEVARHSVERFIAISASAGRRAVLVICGRGQHSDDERSVLRDVIVDFLCSRPALSHVLAFSSAPSAQGGDGALVVLLRRSGKTD